MEPPPTNVSPCVVLGVRVDALTRDATLERIAGWIVAWRRAAETPRRTRQVVTLNPEMVMAARADASLAAVVHAADLVTVDGVGVLWALRRRGCSGVERVAGVDLLAVLAERAAAGGWRLFLLGGAPGVAAEAARRLTERFPGLLVAGTHAGSPAAMLDESQTALVRTSRADLVFVAFGTPAQEQWIARNRDRMGAAVAIGVGGAFDLLAGRVPRAPVWMRRAGLEWSYRLWREPWRWRRMLALPRFVADVLFERLPSRRDASTESETSA